MALKLMYITNRPDVAEVAEINGVDRIFVDLEYIGKAERQGGMDTVQNRHTIEDIRAVRSAVVRSELLVRCNPIHEATEEYGSSAEEIEAIVEAGADIIMLPYFKTVSEVETFISLVNGRAKTMLLVETPDAVANIDGILSVKGIDEVFVGLNDLSLGYKKSFLFELLADGTVEKLCLKFREYGLPYGFGGIASPGKGLVHTEHIVGEHYRLGSTAAILSRSFCNICLVQDIDDIRRIFAEGMLGIRRVEAYWEDVMAPMWDNYLQTCEHIRQIVESRK